MDRPDSSNAARPPGFTRRLLPVLTCGLLGVATLLLQPLPPALLEQAPSLAGLPVSLQRLMLAMNPLALMLIASLTGAALAHRVGLHSLLAGTAEWRGLRPLLASGCGPGLLVAVMVFGLDAALALWLGETWRHGASSRPGWRELLMNLLYGGIGEEILCRWGLMVLLLRLLTPRGSRATRNIAVPCAIALSALAFGAAHLPLLATRFEMDTPLVMRTLLLNGLGGIAYGWLFWRHHLEAAMTAHASTHLGLAAQRRVLTLQVPSTTFKRGRHAYPHRGTPDRAAKTPAPEHFADCRARRSRLCRAAR
ncbi:CPBP family intramembrane metalloprotease [Roseomonas gilardii subsp. gilardii]|uniref:CPBP family intramembrane glutamic endopeptidase n=1 Tax=Roseomonas gilardii TaxID=257708 RepID=UPI001FF7F653|nr:CPBP family intramembrane glutamic endopeptidase [Roseomonas gilardii]UPG73057.1 CPBP family intramembrane metalloprotease [Roseomonas gilardii subsp. gilardii]